MEQVVLGSASYSVFSACLEAAVISLSRSKGRHKRLPNCEPEVLPRLGSPYIRKKEWGATANSWQVKGAAVENVWEPLAHPAGGVDSHRGQDQPIFEAN